MRTPIALDALFQPRAVAVVGAGPAGDVGSVLLRNLLSSPFGGVVYPIDPERKALHGVACHPTLAALPEVPDLAVIVGPAGGVLPAVRACATAGVPAAILLSGGFSEAGPEGVTLEREVKAAAGRVRLLGPNCLGVMHPPGNFNATCGPALARPGRVALVTQSSAIGTSILDWAEQKRIGFSAIVGVGNRVDIDFADLLDHFADDPTTRSIVLHMESIGDVRRFLSAARSVARVKPVIVVKAGRHQASARVETGDDEAFDAAFRRAGVLRVRTIRDLFSMSEILALQPPPRGPALAIVTNSGGPGVMAADALLVEGRLATLASGALNPVDLHARATPEQYRQAVETCVQDSGVQGVLVLLAPQPTTDATETARQLVPLAQSSRPVLACWMGGARVQEGKTILSAAGIPTFDAPEAAVRAFLLMVRYRRVQELLYEKPEAQPSDWHPATLPADAGPDALLAAYGLGPTEETTASGGLELTIGCHVDERFGPVIHFGAGGVVGALLRDRALGLPPLNHTLARRLLERPRIHDALSPTAQDAVESLLVRLSRLVVECPRLREAELPLLAVGDAVIVEPGSVSFWSDEVPPERRPRLVIHPYPNQYTAPFQMRDGRTVIVRVIRPEDEELIVAHHGTLSEQTIRRRYFSLVKTLTRESLVRLCHLDYDREMALAAVLESSSGSRICGVSRYYLDPETNAAEFALVVSDAFQRQGLGRHLMECLIGIARERGIARLVGEVLAENVPMLALLRGLGFSQPRRVSHDVVRVELPLG